jgi:transposase
MSMQIKFLAREGLKKADIARRLGISRQTVYNHLKRTSPFPRRREKRVLKLDAFKGYIRHRLESFDLPATVLHRELVEKGYEGGLTILREFIRPLKAEFIRRVTERFETRPGQQAQLDWGECGQIEEDGQRKTLYVFVLVLGYSRMLYAHFTTSTKLPVLLRCLQQALEVLGIPREILVDNMKQAVDQHDVHTGTVRWNATFLAFAQHYGFLPVACPPYWPRVKGKVERGVGYIKSSFLEGRTVTDRADLNHQLQVWLDTVANVRVHGTTGARPIDRFAEEQIHLAPLAALPAWDVRPLEHRQVPADSHIHYQGVPYSVDPQAVGQTVTVRADAERIGAPFAVYLGGWCVARHIRRRSGHERVTLPEHQAAIRGLTRAGGKKGGPSRGKTPRFTQQPVVDFVQTLLPQLAPYVESASLATYDSFSQEVA